jgi:glycine C-acetyltransferase
LAAISIIFLIRLYLQLEKELETYWDANILIFSTGWMAGYGVIKGLIRENDFIIMDQLSHNCLQEGSNAATKNIRKFEHLNQKAMVELLQQTRASNPDSAILVVTEGLFSMDSDSPDLNFYQKVTKENGAFLLIDCAHDFGHIGDKGRGVW